MEQFDDDLEEGEEGGGDLKKEDEVVVRMLPRLVVEGRAVAVDAERSMSSLEEVEEEAEEKGEAFFLFVERR